MSYHSSAFPTEIATTSLVMFFFSAPAGDIRVNSAGAETVTAGPFQNGNLWVAHPRSTLQRAFHLAQIPKPPRHDAERLFGDRQQNMLIGRMLGAARIGVRHPHRGQAERIGKYVVRQRAAEIWQNRGSLSRRLADRFRRPVDPGAIEIGA